MGVCRRNWVRAFVPLAGTLGRAYAFASLPIRMKNRNSEKMWVQKMIMSFRPSGDGRIAYALRTRTTGHGWLPLDDCWQNRLFAFVPLTGTSVGAYAIRPYPFGQKIGTLKRCGFKKQSCLFDRQGTGASNTPPESGMMGPGRLPLGVCRRNRVRTFVPLAGTLGRAYAIRPYPFG